jgi:hypothetical protein
MKQVAKCPLGSGPGLVRGHFLPPCRRGQEEGKAAMGPTDKGCQRAELGLGGLVLGEMRSGPAQLNPGHPHPHPPGTSISVAESHNQAQPSRGGPGMVGESQKNTLPPKDLLKKSLTDFSLLPQAFIA